jgi:hypothetical protein
LVCRNSQRAPVNRIGAGDFRPLASHITRIGWAARINCFSAK